MTDAPALLPFSPVVEQAIELAAQWHDQTYRKVNWRGHRFDVPEGEPIEVPTITHLVAVAFIVQRAGWDDTTVAAALLHDALEDANRHRRAMHIQELTELLGPGVAELVGFVTEQKFDQAGGVRSWMDRKTDYLAHLESASAPALAISLADKLHNLYSMNSALERGIDVFTDGPGRKGLRAGPAEQLWFHSAVLSISRTRNAGGLNAIADQLEQEIIRFANLTGQSVRAH